MEIKCITLIVKCLWVVAVLYISYLFALNGRYAKIERNIFFDKWAVKGIVIENFEKVE